jgi:hypothetical protein
MSKLYEYYNSVEGEENGVYVSILDADGEWAYWNRIAPHGVDNIIRDKGWAIGGVICNTAQFVFDWGRGRELILRDGVLE